ncbi:MAG TPA: chromosome replication initiation inhibitor protein, partial [Acinetobacter sp.]|nr:chromosome replication initiation inhibitor protein [Acinetobacter sp.]
DFLESNFGLKKSMIPFHIIPSTDSYISGLACDMGYGIMPICKINQDLSNQGIKEISKEYRIKIPLYWHQLSYLSPAVLRMNDIIIKHSTTILATVGNEDA